MGGDTHPASESPETSKYNEPSSYLPRHIIILLAKVKERMLKAARETNCYAKREPPNDSKLISQQKLQARESGTIHSKC